jgi:hypothetical protein
MGSAWLDHVKATLRQNAGKPLKEVLQIAKKTYKKAESVVEGKKVHKKRTRKHAKKSHKKRGRKHAKKSHKKRASRRSRR